MAVIWWGGWVGRRTKNHAGKEREATEKARELLEAIPSNRATPTQQNQECPLAVHVLTSFTPSLWATKMAAKVPPKRWAGARGKAGGGQNLQNGGR